MVEGQDLAKLKAEERTHKLTEIRRKRRGQLSILTMVALLLIFGSFELYHSGLFNVKQVEVRGNKNISLGALDEFCHIKSETNLLSVSTGSIEEKLRKDPWVKEVSVRRVLPSTLRIELVERIPFAVISNSGKYFIIDDDQFALAARPNVDNLSIPVIADMPASRIKIGQRIIDPSLSNAVQCLKQMDSKLRKSITLVSARAVEKLSLYNKDNIEILYGDARLASEKNKILQTILTKQGKQVIFIDIRSYPQNDPVLRRIDAVP